MVRVLPKPCKLHHPAPWGLSELKHVTSGCAHGRSHNRQWMCSFLLLQMSRVVSASTWHTPSSPPIYNPCSCHLPISRGVSRRLGPRLMTPIFSITCCSTPEFGALSSRRFDITLLSRQLKVIPEMCCSFERTSHMLCWAWTCRRSSTVCTLACLHSPTHASTGGA